MAQNRRRSAAYIGVSAAVAAAAAAAAATLTPFLFKSFLSVFKEYI